MAYYATSPQTYTYLWSKYRPAILRMMVDAANGPQEYKFLDHEFKSVNAKEKGGYTFALQLYQGKSVNSVRMSVVAKDLLIILQQSRRALELSDTAIYELTLDKQFVLHAEQLPAPVDPEDPDAVGEEAIVEASAETDVSEEKGEVEETAEVSEEEKPKK